MFIILLNKAIKMPKYLKNETIQKDSLGQKFIVYDYGMGSVVFPVIDTIEELEDRLIFENKKWAKDRLEWALTHSKNEVKYLKKVIETGVR